MHLACPAHLSRRRLALAGLGSAALAACGSLAPPPLHPDGPSATLTPHEDLPPPAPREWRAAWVASVANIDWPKRAGANAVALRDEADALLDRAQALGLNALVLQVRPAADALFPGMFEPWSEFLTGAQGRPPSDGWDPLAHWVDGAHRRGLELHAWFNPYRARHASARSTLARHHIARTRPDLVKTYGDQLWLDPGEPDAAAHTLSVIGDVASRYDIDGVHLDDYFYPYPVKAADGSDRPFPDESSWQRYRRGGGRLGRDDWRRDNVDRLVQTLYSAVHAVKPWLRVGISPFGIGRPGLRPPGIEGFSQYDKLYADVERWCAEGWFDYLAPQLYWPIDRTAQAFEPLLAYWLAQNPHGRHVWPGLFTDSVGKGRQPWAADEVLAQVALLRRPAGVGASPGVRGHTHFSMSVLMQDRGNVATRLAREAYAEPALVPATPWLDATRPEAPAAVVDDAGWRIVGAPGKPAWQWAVWRRVDGRWRFAVQASHDTRLATMGADRVVLSAVDRVGNESERVALTPSG